MTRLFVETNHDLPLVRSVVVVRRGVALDPPNAGETQDRSGLTSFSIDLAARGADGMARLQLDQAMDALGGSIEAIADHDAVYFETTVLRRNLDRALGLLSAVILRPDFVVEEAEKLKRELLGQLEDMRDDDQNLARRYLQRELFAGHPYGRSLVGTKQSIAALSSELARGWQRDAIKAEHCVFGFAGAIVEDEAAALVAKHFATLPTGGSIAAAPSPPAPTRGRRVTLVDKPERTQSQIYFAQTAPGWTHPDYPALLLATTVFGGTFTARLMNEVRSKRGLSYGASARLLNARTDKALLMHVFPSEKQTPETIELVERLFRTWVSEGITQAELDFAQGYLAENFAFNLATPEERLDMRIAIENCALPVDYATTYVPRIRAVTLDDVHAAMKRHLRVEDLQICLVATAKSLLPKLRERGLVDEVKVVPYDEY